MMEVEQSEQQRQQQRVIPHETTDLDEMLHIALAAACLEGPVT